MSLGQSSVSAGSYIATKEVIRGQMNDQMQAMQSPGGQSSQGDLTSLRRQMLDFAQSDGVNNVMTGAGFALAAGGGMVSAAAAAGGFCSVTAGALMAGALTGLATAAGAAIRRMCRSFSSATRLRSSSFNNQTNKAAKPVYSSKTIHSAVRRKEPCHSLKRERIIRPLPKANRERQSSRQPLFFRRPSNCQHKAL